MRPLHRSPEVWEMGPCLTEDGTTPRTSSTSHPHPWVSSAPTTAWTAQGPELLLGFHLLTHPRARYGA